MKRRGPWACAAALLLAGCIDFQQSLEAFCSKLSPQKRAEICLDGPHVVSTTPVSGASGVPLTVRPSVTFDQGVVCGPTGLKLVQFTGGEPIQDGGTTCDGGATATFVPSTQLLSGRVYKVYITGEIRNDAGTPALDGGWTFTIQ